MGGSYVEIGDDYKEGDNLQDYYKNKIEKRKTLNINVRNSERPNKENPSVGLNEASQAQINASPVHPITTSAGKYLAMRLNTPDKADHYIRTIHGVVGPNPKLQTVVNTAFDHVIAGNPAVEKLLYKSHSHGHRHMTIDKSELQLEDDLLGHLEQTHKPSKNPTVRGNDGYWSC